MTSKQTEPDLFQMIGISEILHFKSVHLQLIDVWVEDAIDESNAGTLVGILVRELDVDLPETAFEGSYADD